MMKKPQENVGGRESRVFDLRKRFFEILGGRSAISDLILNPFWAQKVKKTRSKNEVEKRRAKNAHFLMEG